MDIEVLQESGLTRGESKVYLALIKIGSCTSGKIVKESGVSISIVYKIVDNLIKKGLVSYITKEKTKIFRAESPNRILDFIEKRKQTIIKNEQEIKDIIPKLLAFGKDSKSDSVNLYEGFKGFQTAWEFMYGKLSKGDEYHSWGVYPEQEERFHAYWKRDHLKRVNAQINSKILFNQGTDIDILKNRNSFTGCEARYMPSDIKTPAWFVVYKDVTGIFLQRKNPLAVLIVNKEITESFEQYFKDLWKNSKPI